jgi:hypothetical protein
MEQRKPGEWRDGDGIICHVSAFRDPKWRRANGLPPVPPRKPLAQKRRVRGDIQDRGRRDSL